MTVLLHWSPKFLQLSWIDKRHLDRFSRSLRMSAKKSSFSGSHPWLFKTRELTTAGLYCCHKMSPNILTISNERPYLIETLTEPLEYHSHCTRTGTRFLSRSVTTIWQNWNGEAHCSTSVCCGRSNCRWSNFSILLLFKWAVSNQWVSRAVYSVSITSTWSACVTDSSLNTTAYCFLSVLSYVLL